MKITPSRSASVKIRTTIVYLCDLGKKPITLCLRAGFTNSHRNITINHSRRHVLRDERTGYFLCGTDYSRPNGGLTGFIVF